MKTEKRNFRSRLLLRVRKTHPLLLARLMAVGILAFPLWIIALIQSLIQAHRWRRVETCRKFIQSQQLAFADANPVTLKVEAISKGISNYNAVWMMRTFSGEEVRYFAKIFLPLGSLWATLNAMASPFPLVRARRTQERFSVDMMSRSQFAERQIPVPKLIAFDAVSKIMVNEYLEGEVVDDVLKRIEARGSITLEDEKVIQECAHGLAKAHSEGFSLIDTQPVNCIWVPDRRQVYFIDLEYCTREDLRVWDVGFFLAFLTVRFSEDMARETRSIFLACYQAKRHIDWQSVMKTSGQLKLYLPVFLTILDIRDLTPEQLFQELLI